MTHVCKPILHGHEYVCGQCGIVDQEMTKELQSKLTKEEEAATTAMHHSPMNRLVNTDRYYNDNSKGDIFEELGNAKASDFQGKRVKRAVLQDGYQVMYANARRGEFRWNGKYRAAYDMDKWVSDVSQVVMETCDEAGIDIETAHLLKGGIVRAYSKIILGPMVPLICALSFKAASIAAISQETRLNIERSIPQLLEHLNREFDRIINAEHDEELESLIEKPGEIPLVSS